MKIQNWIDKNCKRLDGKTVCITGSTGGLAQEFTIKLASLGANLIFANRNKQKSEKQKQDILSKFPNTKIQILVVDMFDINSVKLFVRKLKQLSVDIIIINSAVYNVPRATSTSGFDNVFQINFVSPYFIIKQMMPTLQKVKDSKVIIIGSIAYNYSKVDFSDIQRLKTKKPSIIYGNSKRFLMFALCKLFENTSVNLSIVHPGITLTNMTNHYPKFVNWFVKIGIKILFSPPKKACLSVLAGTSQSTKFNEWIGPSKFNIWGFPKKQKLNTCSSAEATKIFNTAEKIYKDISLPIKNATTDT